MSTRTEKIITVVMMLAVITPTLAHGAVEPWSVALLQLMFLILFVLWALRAIFEEKVAITVPKVYWPLLAFIGLGILQCISLTDSGGRRHSLSLDVEATRKAVFMIGLLTGVAFLAGSLFRNRERFELLSKFLIIYGFGLSLFALIQHFTWNGAFYWLRANDTAGMPFGPFVNHAHFAGYMEMLMPLPLALIVTKAVRKEARLFCGFATFVMGMALIFSLSRGGIVGAAVGLLFMAVSSLTLRTRRAREDEYERQFERRRLPLLLRRAGIVLGIMILVGGGIIWIGAEPVIDRLGRCQSLVDYLHVRYCN